MPLWSADELAAVTGGRWLDNRPPARLPTGITYDLGYQRPGDLFITMNSQTYDRGEAVAVGPVTWDSANRLRELQALGCAGAIIERDVTEAPPRFPLLRVADSAEAVKALGAAGRARFGGALIAVTGTVGKSTTREMIRHVLSHQAKTFGYAGNFNTYFSMALCMAQLNPKSVYAVFEVAMSALYRKENPIATQLRPNVAIITAIAREQTILAPTLEHTARYKARLFKGLAPGGTAVINRDMEMFDKVLERAQRFRAPRIVTYGRHPEAGVRLLDCQHHSEYSNVRAAVHGNAIDYEVPIPGSSMIANSLAMLAAVEAVGADWRQAARDLASYQTRQGRLQRVRVPVGDGHFDLIDDTWNNTEAAMLANFEVLRLSEPAPGGRRIAVLQQIGWIDGISQDVHAGLAGPLKDSRADRVFTMGDEMLHLRENLPAEMLGLHAKSADELAAAVLDEVRPGDVVSAKGSSITAGFDDVMRRLRRGRPAIPTSTAAREGRIERGPVTLRDRREVSINLLGDFYLGDAYQRRREKRGGVDYLRQHGYSYSLRNFADFLNNADFSVVNFDGVLTRPVKSPIAGDKKWLFDADPRQTLKTLRACKIGAVALGNSHSFDFGLDALWAMLAQFAKAGIHHFGADRRDGGAIQPLRIAADIAGRQMGVQIFSALQYSRKADEELKVLAGPGRGGVACLSEELMAAIAAARQAAPKDLIIAFPCWGAGYSWRIPAQKEMASWLIGAGADLVIGNGAHMLQEVERVDGRWVINGLGNSILNNEGEYGDRKVPPYSLAARLELSSVGGSNLNRSLKLYPLLSDNQRTDFRPRFVDAAEFESVKRLLMGRNAELAKETEAFAAGYDRFGWHFQILFDRPAPARPQASAPPPKRAAAPTLPAAVAQPLQAARDNPLSLWGAQELAAATDGFWLSEPAADWCATGVSITRKRLRPGDLFICMDAATWHGAEATIGPDTMKETWDTAQDIAGLKALGAVAAIVQRDVDNLPNGFPVLRVNDSAQAIHDLAAAARARFRGKCIALTGTVGKTTTREMLKHVLGFQGRASASTANFNTRLGVPYSVAQTPADGDYAVFEIAVSALYATAGSVSMAVLPHVAVFTTVGVAHVTHVSSVEGTARYKSRIFQGLAAGGVAVINRDMDLFPLVAQLAQEYGAGEIVTFGVSDQADVRLRHADMAADHSRVTADVFGEPVSYEVPVAGKGMIMNSLACLAAARAAGADWRQAAADLALYRTKSGRLHRWHLPVDGGSWELIDDAANAAPMSMKQGIEALGLAQPTPGGRRIAVLGRMAELGDRTLEMHAGLAPVLLDARIDKLFTVHDELKPLRDGLPAGMLAPHADSTKDLMREVLADVRPGDVVLVKGSHSGSDFFRLPEYIRQSLPANGEGVTDGDPRPQRAAAVAAAKTVHLTARHSLDVCLIGDTYFGEFYQELRKKRGMRNYLATRGYDYALERFAGFLQAADFSVVNLEATLTERETSPFGGTKDWILKGDPAKTLASLKAANIGAAALGNNHTFDYGRAALDDTLAAVRSAGLACFGAGDNAAEAAAPLEIGLSLAGGSRRLALFSAYQYARDLAEDLKGYARGAEGGIACIDETYYAAIATWKEENPDGIAIAFPHWGRNYVWRTADQQKTADKMIDAGADLIIGHGAHMMQEIELRRDRWVVYSLGNGYFGSEGEYARRSMPPYSFLARLNLSDPGGKAALSLRLYPIVSDNQKTRFQPRFVTVGEFREVNTVLEVRNAGLFAAPRTVQRDRDEFGWYIELPVA
jgi:UDP-N-acetylmuramoyl-tripeptide--D-alanyl-D-alanine ligase